jgi:5,10-methenyltetrahydrofolate synthetase
MRMELNKLTAVEKLAAATAVLENIKILLQSHYKVALYHALPYEISMLEVINYCKLHDIVIYAPVAYPHNKIMSFVPFDDIKSAFCSADYILPHNSIKANELDLVILPLRAVAISGVRLGHGNGYYDATFAQCERMRLCGVGYQLQLVQHISADIWDVPLGYFASEVKLIQFS